jgi:hypothetical protein
VVGGVNNKQKFPRIRVKIFEQILPIDQHVQFDEKHRRPTILGYGNLTATIINAFLENFVFFKTRIELVLQPCYYNVWQPLSDFWPFYYEIAAALLPLNYTNTPGLEKKA